MCESGFSFSEIAEITGGSLSGDYTDSCMKELLTDSRKLSTPCHTLFFALITASNDGHKYIVDLYRRGLRHFVVSDLPDEVFPGAGFIVVTHTLEALQKVAAKHRSLFSLPVIGITGSNGKTIVKEWLWQLLSLEYTLVRSPRSYNSQIGVPLSVWQISKIHNLAVFEAGISKPGEMAHLATIIQPDIGILTNIGHAHDQFFDSLQQKLEEKLLLFEDSTSLIYCSDTPWIHQKIVAKQKPGQTLFSWGAGKENTLQIIQKTVPSPGITCISAIFQGKEISIHIPFADAAHIENAIHCWCVMLLFEYGTTVVNERMRQLHSVEMRLQMNAGINGCSIINDAYSFDPDSLRIALDFLMQQNQHESKCLILSDMQQGEPDEPALYERIAQMVNSRNINRLIGIGEVISRYGGLFNAKSVFYKDTADFIKDFKSGDYSNESILVKGAREFGFEKITGLLIQKSHETVLEVNLDALVHNLNHYRSKLSPGTKLMAMVKAFSYGSGSFEIANTLEHHRADYLAVAYADEGVELRKAGISLPIMVMNPEASAMAAILAYQLEPEVYNLRSLNLLGSAIKRLKTDSSLVNIHVKFDTGMHRLGFSKSDLSGLFEALKSYPQIRVASAFSHLVGSEDPNLDDFTRKQIKDFTEMAEKLKKSIGYNFIRHITNSAGIARFPQAQFEMVRLGISLYGISADEEEQSALEPVTTLRTSVSQIINVKSGDSVGYNRSWKASRDSKIATIPIGYADGLDRKLSNGKGRFLVNGKVAAVAGNVCMDMTMLDITGIKVIEGDDVLIFGHDWPINQLAEAIGTIPYEILTGVSARVKRLYFRE